MANPFVTLEALQEHIGASFVAGGVHQANEQNDPIKWPMGSVPYHLQAVQDAGQRLFQELIALLPEEYATYRGED